MDINLLYFFSALSIIMFVIGGFIGAWVKLALGWLAGGLMIIVGMTVGAGNDITSTIAFDTSSIVTVPLELGISNENFMIIFILAGLVMIIVATFMEGR